MPMTVQTPRVPKVKEYETPVFRAPEGPRLRNIDAMTQGAAAGVALGQKISALGTDLMNTVVQKQKEIQHGEGITLGSKKSVEYSASLDDLEKEYEPKITGDNSPQISEEYDQKKAEIGERYRAELKSNPVALQFFERHAPQISLANQRSFSNTVKGISSNTAVFTHKEQASQSSNQANVFDIFERYDQIKEDVMGNTAIPGKDRPRVADELSHMYLNSAYERLLQDEKSGMLVAMTMPEFRKKLEARDTHAKMGDYVEKFEKVKNEATLTNADVALKSNPENINPDGTYNYTKMLSDLTKPETYSKLGLTAEQAAKQKTIYNAEENEAKSKKLELDKKIKDDYENQINDAYSKMNYTKILKMAIVEGNPLTPDERKGWIDVAVRIPKEQARLDRMEAKADKADRREEVEARKRSAASDMLVSIYSDDTAKQPKNELEIITALAPIDPKLAGQMVDEYRQNKNQKDIPLQTALKKVNDYKAKGFFSTNAEKNIDLASKATLRLHALKGQKGVDLDAEVEKIRKESQAGWMDEILSFTGVGRFTSPTNREDVLNPDKMFIKGQIKSEVKSERTVVESWTGKKTGKIVIKYSDGTIEYAD